MNIKSNNQAGGFDYDFLVIGGGSAGYNGAAQAAQLGLKTAVIEREQQLGGLCILRGCMPSKTLLASANRMLLARTAADFGIRVASAVASMPEIAARKKRLIEEFAQHRRDQLLDGRFSLLRGEARFVDEHTIELSDFGNGCRQLITARFFLVATGSTHRRIVLEGLDEAGYWTSDEALDASHLPGSVVILGGGAVALEFAHFYNALGIPVHVLQRSPRVLSMADPDVSASVEQALRDRGVRISTNTKLLRVTKEANLVKIIFECGGQQQEAHGELILNALGRVPSTERLGLDAAGVELAADGKIKVEPTMQTTRPHIFAAGDVCAQNEVVHEAVRQGEIAARNAHRLQRGAIPTQPLERENSALKMFAIFCGAEAAMVGVTEEEARRSGVCIKTARYDLSDHGKAMVEGHTEGFVKLVADEEGKLVGAAMVGVMASELIHIPACVISVGGTAQDLLRVPLYHPTLAEVWSYPAEELARQV